MRRISALLAAVVCSFITSAPSAAVSVQTIRSLGGLPPHLVGRFEEPASFQQSANGLYYVFDRRGHAVWTVDPKRTSARKAVDIGGEQGRILEPYGFDVARDGTFIVADVPLRSDRVQLFGATGEWKTGFFITTNSVARITIGNVVLSGIGSIKHAGQSLLVSYPETGALFNEYSFAGATTRGIGRLRTTGYEQDRDLHIAMNAGIPLVDPTGGYYFVFIAGRPMFRKYDAAGKLMFERHVEGREIDDLLDSQPTQWPRRVVADREMPIVTPVIRAAAVDARGQLWLSLMVPFTYVYDRDGDKARTVQFSAAGIISPTSLSFAPNGRLLVTPGCYEFDPAS